MVDTHQGLSMKKINRNAILSLCALTFLSFTSIDSVAQDTSKPITLVVPFGSGGSTDITARLLADKLRIELGQTIVVENKGGAAGNIGAAQVARAPPDGLTLLFITSTQLSNPSLYKNLSYDVMKDLTPISRVAFLPNMLVVNKDFPANTLQEFVTYVKEKKGPINYGSSGTGTSQHLAGALFNNMAGGGMVHVPYKGGGAAVTDLMGGQTDFMFATPQSVLGMIAGGKLRALAVTSANRIGVLSKIPTVSEEGYKGFEATDWKIVVAPAGTPPVAIKKINEAVQKSLKNPALISKLQDEASTPMYGDPATVLKYIRAEQREWEAAVKAAGIKLD